MTRLVSQELQDLKKMISAPKARPRGRPRSEAAEKAVMDSLQVVAIEGGARDGGASGTSGSQA
jgi:hypothetical protein